MTTVGSCSFGESRSEHGQKGPSSIYMFVRCESETEVLFNENLVVRLADVSDTRRTREFLWICDVLRRKTLASWH